jgi:hypothetical protein
MPITKIILNNKIPKTINRVIRTEFKAAIIAFKIDEQDRE